MKKFMMFVAAAVMTIAANAQNPDAVKQVKAAQKYSEANEVMKAMGESMTPAERAQSYNILVDLAIKDYEKASTKKVEADLKKDEAESQKQSEKAAKAAYNAVKAAQLCDKADREPNEKGQVKPKFRKKNAARVSPCRQTLCEYASTAYNGKDFELAKKYFGMYAEARYDELYTDYDFKAETNYYDYAYYAGVAAYYAKDYKKTVKYADYAIATENPDLKNDAIVLKVNGFEEQAKEGIIDTTACIKKIKQIYKQYPDNQATFTRLYALYEAAGQAEDAAKLLGDRLKSDPNDIMAHAFVAQNAQNAGEYGKAIEAYENVLKIKPDFIECRANLAVCYLGRGRATVEAKTDTRGNLNPAAKPEVLADFEKAKAIFEECKAADPGQERVKWAYYLDSINYAIEQVK